MLHHLCFLFLFFSNMSVNKFSFSAVTAFFFSYTQTIFMEKLNSFNDESHHYVKKSKGYVAVAIAIQWVCSYIKADAVDLGSHLTTA